MIFRNSIKSILRTPVKTVFFALLIAAVTALSGHKYMGSQCSCYGIGIHCYHGISGGLWFESGSKSEAMLADIAGMDFDAIATNEIILWQPADMGMGTARALYQGLWRSYSDACVLINGAQAICGGQPHGEILEPLSFTLEPAESIHRKPAWNAVVPVGAI